MTASGDWQPGPVGQGAVPGSDGQLVNLDVAPLRRAVRFVMWSALAGREDEAARRPAFRYLVVPLRSPARA